MSRRSLILCLSALAVMILGVGVAVAFLYSGSGRDSASASKVADETRYLLFPAVPSDAVAVFCSSEAEGSFLSAFSEEIVQAAGDSRVVVSLHHSGKTLVPLFVIDAGKTSEKSTAVSLSLMEAAAGCGMHADTISCASVSDVRKNLASRSLVVVSKLENLVNSSIRHLRSGESVMDASGFTEVSAMVSGEELVFISNAYSQKFASAMFSGKYRGYAAFFSRFADWTAFSVGDDFSLEGAAASVKQQTDFMSVLDASQPATSGLSSVVPAYTIFAASLPMKDVDAYLSAYEGFVDSKHQLASYKARLKELSKTFEIQTGDLLKLAQPAEIASASFKVSGRIERVNLMRIASGAVGTFCPEAASKGQDKAVYPYKYAGFASAYFGDLFALADESCCTYVGGWLVTGSRKAVDEYVSNGALEYTLADKMKDSDQQDLLARTPAVFVLYFSLSEDKDELSGIFSPGFLKYVGSLTEGQDYCPFVLTAVKGKKRTVLHADLLRTTVKRSKAPAADRDTTVVIPEGPYEVRNSGTGKMNKFYQNSHLSLCLSQDGKDLWGIPFQQKICGIATTIDYYANGKLQILFGAGSRMYLIDRLGRFVNGFPVDLGKEILLGPEPYDFNGVHRYNVMVLHKDKTIEMYDMKGRKPDSWKGIKSEETIKALPQKISAAGKSYWVVRTSVQTLVFPLMGGEPLTVFEGDKMIRPDSEIKVLEGPALGFECYDGQTRTLKL